MESVIPYMVTQTVLALLVKKHGPQQRSIWRQLANLNKRLIHRLECGW